MIIIKVKVFQGEYSNFINEAKKAVMIFFNTQVTQTNKDKNVSSIYKRLIYYFPCSNFSLYE